jgi:hypothetical protein
MKTVHIPNTRLDKHYEFCVDFEDDLHLFFDIDGFFAWSGGGDTFTPALPRGLVTGGKEHVCVAPKSKQTIKAIFVSLSDGSFQTIAIDVRKDATCRDKP